MPIQNGTLEVLYCFLFLYLVFAGGVRSLDAAPRKEA
jgi:hypothetical protein